MLAVDIGIRGDGDPLMGHRVQRPQHAEPMPATGRSAASSAPGTRPSSGTARGRSGRRPKNFAPSGLRLFQPRGQRFGFEAGLFRPAFRRRRRSRDRPALRRRSPNCLSTLPTWAGLRSIPVSSAIRVRASARVAGGAARTPPRSPLHAAPARRGPGGTGRSSAPPSPRLETTAGSQSESAW